MKNKTKKMYCICLDYEKESLMLYNFADFKKDVVAEYKRLGLYKPEYTVVEVKVIIK